MFDYFDLLTFFKDSKVMTKLLIDNPPGIASYHSSLARAFQTWYVNLPLDHWPGSTFGVAVLVRLEGEEGQNFESAIAKSRRESLGLKPDPTKKQEREQDYLAWLEGFNQGLKDKERTDI